TGPFLLPVAESLLGVGAQVIGLLEANSLRTVRKGWSSDPLVAPSKLREAAGYGALLARHRIPLRHGWTVIAADGADRVEAATIARLDDDWRPVPGSGRRVAVDAICVGFGFTANLELAVSARCTLTTGPDGGPAVSVDANQQTSAAGFFAAGELTGIGGAALSAAEGAVAGTSAARHVTSAAETRLADPSAARHSTSPAESTLGGASAERYVRSAAEGALAEASAARYVASAAEPPAQATADSAVEKGSVDPAVEDGAADAAVARGAAGPAVEDGAADAAGAVDPAVVRGRRFAGVLARAYPVRDGWKSWSTAATIVCRCEEVTRGELEDAASTRGLADGRAMKLSSRAGLGMCQGRVCSRTVAALLAGPGEVPSPSMKRPIAVPVRLRDLAAADVARVNQDVEHDRVAESAETMEEQ
ncbi:(2Fe-2S)-binding protein, partial [Kribbella sp.]|uniref:(2Fe-2S)-binding protein n=1 Tax=Kribbella sp. TaxID=1871183 RepID=UPI002D33EC6B